LKSSVTAGLTVPPARALRRGRRLVLAFQAAQVEEVLQNDMPCSDAMLSGWNARRDRQGLVRKTHDQMVVGFSDGRKLVGHGGAIDHQRMVARGLERAIDASEHAVALVLDRRELAMHRDGCPHHLAAEHLPDCLVAEADAEQRNGRGRRLDQVKADAGIVRRAGAGRQHDRLRVGANHLGGRDLFVAMHHHLRTQFTQIVKQVEGEAVVIVDQDDHGFSCPLRVLEHFGGKGKRLFVPKIRPRQDLNRPLKKAPAVVPGAGRRPDPDSRVGRGAMNAGSCDCGGKCLRRPAVAFTRSFSHPLAERLFLAAVAAPPSRRMRLRSLAAFRIRPLPTDAAGRCGAPSAESVPSLATRPGARLIKRLASLANISLTTHKKKNLCRNKGKEKKTKQKQNKK